MDAEFRESQRDCTGEVSRLVLVERSGGVVDPDLLEEVHVHDPAGAGEWLREHVSRLGGSASDRLFIGASLGCASAGVLTGTRPQPALLDLATSFSGVLSDSLAFGRALIQASCMDGALAWLSEYLIDDGSRTEHFYQQSALRALASRVLCALSREEAEVASQLSLFVLTHIGRTALQKYGIPVEVSNDLSSCLELLSRCALSPPYRVPSSVADAGIRGVLGLGKLSVSDGFETKRLLSTVDAYADPFS